ncbi:hypothetical protein HDU67_000896 [Dinochytrium kinnereticum]|nr:hypothetical protein HDU67_000896 [Dinochytrium kinnereticum]
MQCLLQATEVRKLHEEIMDKMRQSDKARNEGRIEKLYACLQHVKALETKRANLEHELEWSLKSEKRAVCTALKICRTCGSFRSVFDVGLAYEILQKKSVAER